MKLVVNGKVKPQPVRLIGLHGGIGVGKDTFADIAKELLSNRGVWTVGYADPIKRIAQQLYGFSAHDLWGPSSARAAISPLYKDPSMIARFVLQKLGTEVCRAIHPDTWLKAFEDTFKKLDGSARYSREGGVLYDDDDVVDKNTYSNRVIVTDVRFKNELTHIKMLGGVLVKIIRPVEVSAEQNSIPDHISNQVFPDELFDYVLPNNGSLADYRYNIGGLLVDIDWLVKDPAGR